MGKSGVAYLESVVSKSSVSPALVGRDRPFLPQSSASIFMNYAVTEKLSLGGGDARYVGSMKTDTLGITKDLPSYTVVDAMAGYQWGDWQFQLNLNNLLDKKYFVNSYNNLVYGHDLGQPLRFSVSARLMF